MEPPISPPAQRSPKGATTIGPMANAKIHRHVCRIMLVLTTGKTADFERPIRFWSCRVEENSPRLLLSNPRPEVRIPAKPQPSNLCKSPRHPLSRPPADAHSLTTKYLINHDQTLVKHPAQGHLYPRANPPPGWTHPPKTSLLGDDQRASSSSFLDSNPPRLRPQKRHTHRSNSPSTHHRQTDHWAPPNPQTSPPKPAKLAALHESHLCFASRIQTPVRHLPRPPKPIKIATDTVARPSNFAPRNPLASHRTPYGRPSTQLLKSQRFRPYSPDGASPALIKLSHASFSDTVLLTQSVAQLRPSHSSCLPQTGQTINQFSRLFYRHGVNYLPPQSTPKALISGSTVVLLNPRCTAS